MRERVAAVGACVSPVASKADREAFISFPWRIYASDPAWAPPLRREVARFIDAEHHPFYRHGAAQLFLARRNDAGGSGEAVGRIMASDDPHYNAEHGTNVGMFGLFESVDDPAVAHALLDAAEAWLRGRGRTAMLGPIDYSTNYSCGLLVAGFETSQRLLMTHNPRYYRPLLESYGLRPVKELYAWWIDRVPDLSGWLPRIARARIRGVTIRHMRKADLAAEITRARAIYDEAWARNWGWVRMTDAELDYLGRELAQIADERLCLIAEIGAEPVGFALALPDVNEAFRAVGDGRLARWGLPIGLVRLLLALRRIRTFRFFTLGVRPGFQARGIAEALMARVVEVAAAAGYAGAEMGWTLEDNVRVNRAIGRVVKEPYKRYLVYEKEL